MRQSRIGIIGQSLETALLSQSFEHLYGVEPIVLEVPEDPGDISRVLRSAHLGGLVVGAPLLKRIHLIRKALDEGLPVLAETPLASDLESVAGLIEERTQRPGPPLIPITPWRFSPDLQLARGILAGGALGDPVTFQVTLPGPEGFLYPNGERIQSPVTAAAVVMHEGWQAFDLVRHLIGEVYSLEAIRIRGVNNSPSLEGVAIAVRCGGGWNGKICLSVEPVTPKTHWVNLKGSEGAIELGWDSSSFVPADGEAARIGQGCFGMDNYERLANAFADVASFRVDPWMGDIDLMRTMDLMQAAQMSLGAGLAVEAPRRQRRVVAA